MWFKQCMMIILLITSNTSTRFLSSLCPSLMRPRVSSISNSSDDGPDLELPGRDDVETAEGGREAIFCGKTTQQIQPTRKMLGQLALYLALIPFKHLDVLSFQNILKSTETFICRETCSMTHICDNFWQPFFTLFGLFFFL